MLYVVLSCPSHLLGVTALQQIMCQVCNRSCTSSAPSLLSYYHSSWSSQYLTVQGAQQAQQSGRSTMAVPGSGDSSQGNWHGLPPAVMEQIRSTPKQQRPQAMQALMQSMPGYDGYRVSRQHLTSMLHIHSTLERMTAYSSTACKSRSICASFCLECSVFNLSHTEPLFGVPASGRAARHTHTAAADVTAATAQQRRRQDP